jgi:molybdopterin/thiamine biosynthesis adenylyltransferase
MKIDFKTILENHPCVRSVEYISTNEKGDNSKATPQFRVYAHENWHDWKLIVELNDSFPLVLPEIYLENAEDYSAMGHVNWHGDICYKDKQGLALDYKKPEIILNACIYEALRTLQENYTDTNKVELQKDFKSYWESYYLSIDFKTTCIITPNKIVKEIIACRDTRNERKTKFPSCLAIIEPEHNLNQYYHLIYSLKDNKKDKSIYIPLESFVMPPNPKQVWNSSNILDIYEKYTDSLTKIAVKKILEKFKWSDYFTLVFSHPSLNFERTLWAVQFYRKEKALHPLLNPKDDWLVCPLPLRIHSKEYLLERCGSSITLDNKKVAVIGCGSVGAGIALQLAKAGIGELHLIDFDKMEIENIYRHVLGASSINNTKGGYYKNFALKCEIESNIPYTKIEIFNDKLQNVAKVKEIFNIYDAIVIATGDFTQELYFNSIHKKTSKTIPVIYAWQDGFGIGGHAITVINDGNAGCLECLYTKSSGFEPHAKTSFIEYGQTISKHLGGCSGVFTPFSFLDASQTALLASRMVLKALQDKAKNEIRSWKGSDEQLKAEGYTASNWYKKSPEHFIQDDKNYISAYCAICGKND